jgi:uncharacterized protein
MKRVFIIHGWQGTPEHGWKFAVRDSLQQKGFAVFVPRMPDTDKPKESEWLSYLQTIICTPDSDTYLIGHSLGCTAILRYLESLNEGHHIGGAILVAAFLDDLGIPELSNFYEKPFQWEKIKKRSKNIVVINSTNDYYVPMSHGEMFKELLGDRGEVIIMKDMKHFSGDDGVVDLPVVVDTIQEFSNR